MGLLKSLSRPMVLNVVNVINVVNVVNVVSPSGSWQVVLIDMRSTQFSTLIHHIYHAYYIHHILLGVMVRITY
jgi:hypothetical protein